MLEKESESDSSESESDQSFRGSHGPIHLAPAGTNPSSSPRHHGHQQASRADTLVLLLGLTAGMRVTEIAQIEVQDVLFPSGALREEISLRAAITKGCRQRCIYLSHAKAIDAIDQYLSYRLCGACERPAIRAATEALSRQAN